MGGGEMVGGVAIRLTYLYPSMNVMAYLFEPGRWSNSGGGGSCAVGEEAKSRLCGTVDPVGGGGSQL